MNFILAAVSGQSLVHSFFVLVIVALIVWVLLWALGAIGVPEPFNKVIRVVIILLACLFLVNWLLGLIGSPVVSF